MQAKLVLKVKLVSTFVLHFKTWILLTCFWLLAVKSGKKIAKYFVQFGTYFFLHLCLCVCFLLWCFWCPSPCLPLPLFVMRLRVIPLIVVVSPSLYLHSRSRPSANSNSSSSWLPLGVQDQDHLLCCWAPGPQPLQPRAREGWSNQVSSESAVVQTRWLVFHSGLPSLF